MYLSPKRRTIVELFHGLQALYQIVVTTKATEESTGIFSLSYDSPSVYFAHIEANDSLATDFDNRDIIGSHHCAFHVNHKDSYQVFNRTSPENIPHGSHPSDFEDMPFNSPRHN